jgi:predicted RNase H-like HicB family nuclease
VDFTKNKLIQRVQIDVGEELRRLVAQWQPAPPFARRPMTYLAIYEKTATGYSAYVPDLPGCITTGRTMNETARLMQEAIDFHIEGLREDGLPIPEPATAAGYVEASARPAA